jgi:hypothetical protein
MTAITEQATHQLQRQARSRTPSRLPARSTDEPKPGRSLLCSTATDVTSMDHKDHAELLKRWVWVERSVNPAEGHFELHCGSARNSDSDAWVPVGTSGSPYQASVWRPVHHRSHHSDLRGDDRCRGCGTQFLPSYQGRAESMVLRPVPLRNIVQRLLLDLLVVSPETKERRYGPEGQPGRRGAHRGQKRSNDRES